MDSGQGGGGGKSHLIASAILAVRTWLGNAVAVSRFGGFELEISVGTHALGRCMRANKCSRGLCKSGDCIAGVLESRPTGVVLVLFCELMKQFDETLGRPEPGQHLKHFRLLSNFDMPHVCICPCLQRSSSMNIALGI